MAAPICSQTRNTHPQQNTELVCLYANRHPDMMKYYKHAMSTPLREIRSQRVWHILFSWHFYVHVSTASESLAESVGSFLQVFRRQNVSSSLGTKRTVWATQLRAMGFRGLGGEDGMLSMALSFHFDSTDPSGWHFQSANGDRTTKVEMHQETRLLRQPPWVSFL